MIKSFEERLDQTEGLPDIFEVVKDAVRKTHKVGRAGLTLGLAELGAKENYLIGAFYPFGSNIIIMNKTPLRKILESNPELFKPYSFHVLLHEYLHALGNLDEGYVREKTYRISGEVFGSKHLATQMAKDLNKFIPNLTYPSPDWRPSNQLQIELIQDFDKSSVNYIA